MRKLLCVLPVLAVLAFAPAANAQNVEVNRENRTVAVSVTDTVEVAAEVAVVQIGYHNFGPTRDTAYKQNAEIAEKIVDALIASGLKKEDIETAAVQLDRVDPDGKQWTADERKERQYEVDQGWSVRVAAPDGQKVADLAVAAGANELQEITWSVRDSAELDARACSMALTRARGLADKMVQQFGGKTGALLYVSNSQLNGLNRFLVAGGGGGGGNNFSMTDRVGPSVAVPILKLFPQKVRRDATVYAIFALE